VLGFASCVFEIGTNGLGDLRLLTVLRARPMSKCSEQRFSSLDFWLLFIDGKVTLKIDFTEINHHNNSWLEYNETLFSFL